MERLGIKRIDGEYPRVILYNNDKVSLEVSFEGNLDLYFVLKGADIDNKVIINESNLRVYDTFNELYESLINCSLPYEIRDKNLLRRTSNYDMLVQDKVIKWACDDYSVDVGPFFEIAKVNDEFVITFDRGNIEKQFLASKYSISVRLRNSGSLYHPFNANFMRLYHELCDLDLDQIYIDEIGKLKRIKV